jgi:1-acyl-sn-glycerol-3-phosphate acyltransferase
MGTFLFSPGRLRRASPGSDENGNVPVAENRNVPVFALHVQREVGRLLAPLWVLGSALLLRFVGGYRIEGMAAARHEYRRIRAEHHGPLLICANHLTMIDSALIAWALGSPLWYLLHYSALPWNVPEQRNFAASSGQRIVSWVMKCRPVTRGGERTEVARVLAGFTYLLSLGDAGLVFPEGGRSRTGRVDVEAAAPGVGRIVQSLPGCLVLCVYLRGHRQENYSNLPARGERFHIDFRRIEPSSPHRGLRGSREIAQRIVAELAEMERTYFDDRQ